MISLARKALLNSFFSQPCRAEAEGRYICTVSGLCSAPAPSLCPNLFTRWKQRVENCAESPLLQHLHIKAHKSFMKLGHIIPLSEAESHQVFSGSWTRAGK